MLKMSQSFVVRMSIWSALVLYMVCDFFFFKGPLKQELSEMFPTPQDELQEARDKGICAKVYNAPIYLSQVNRRITENLWRNGRAPEVVKNPEMSMLRSVALNDLIDESLLRIKVHANRSDVPVSEEIIDAEVKRFTKRFPSTNDLDAAMKAQGIENMKELRYRLAARVQQEQYVLSKIEPAIAVTDAEARQWYDENKESITIPEHRRIRHVFIATLDRNPSDVRQVMTRHLEALQTGGISFEKLAETVSEDARSKNRGGDLSWMTNQRVIKDFSDAVFHMPTGTAELIQTKLGWHIVEVTAVKAPELLSYETMKDDIITSLRDSKRQDAILQYRHQLRLLNHKKIDIYPSILAAENTP